MKLEKFMVLPSWTAQEKFNGVVLKRSLGFKELEL
jgi:hypothetical protein